MLALITSNTGRATTEPTQLLIDVSTPDGRLSGLLHPSAVKCEHLMTLHAALIDRVIGQLPATLMLRVDQCLKAALGLL